jgi:hypothetical protein
LPTSGDCCRKGYLIARGSTCPRLKTGRALECRQLARASAPIGARVIDLISHAPADGLILEFSLDFQSRSFARLLRYC